MDESLKEHLTRLETKIDRVQKDSALLKIALGINGRSAGEVASDVEWLRAQKQASVKTAEYVKRSFITILIAGGIGALWVGIKVSLGVD